MKKITVALLLFLTLLACERDDICSESNTTARIKIAFFDANLPNEDAPKTVFKLRVQGVGNDNVLEGYNATDKSDMLLPLKTTENTTQYKVHKNYSVDDNDNILGNEDIITISYTLEQEYLSRACGYKTVFKNVTITVEDDGNTWIQNILPANDNLIVDNEDEIHYNIYH
ncbi:DUF6452 family protein [Mangrovimonas yunxiaonensis]|nr:DUF6452 family protein [Mangrovimonas yunxiaonensis]MBR9757051.1 hypothetical protein [Algicola sp.]